MVQGRLMMFSLKMVDYPMSFLSLSTWDFFAWHVGGTILNLSLVFGFWGLGFGARAWQKLQGHREWVKNVIHFLFKAYLRQYNNTLEKIVALYNDLRLNCIPEEFKLIEEEMASLDNDLQPAENTLTWHSTEIKVNFWVKILYFFSLNTCFRIT